MSQKPVKVGLSKANVNAIALAIGTATLNRLVPIFSTSVAYKKGQYTNYNNQLYRFTADKSAGAWDSTKVESASLNDLINDVNEAVATINNKANVDGNYPTLTAGLADNLTPYSEDSGAEQTKPFISNGTGTNNNTEIVTVSDYGLLKEKQGHILVVNQLVPNVISTKTISGVTFTKNNDGTLTINGTASAEIGTASLGEILTGTTTFHRRNHYVLVSLCIDTINGLYFGVGGYNIDKNKAFLFKESDNTDWNSHITCHILGGTVFNNLKIRPIVVDLTQMFNGEIPQDLLDNQSHFSWYYNGDLSYNAGSLENANGVRLVSTGRNLWDEERDENKYLVNGVPTSVQGYFVSKNFVVVTPNKLFNINGVGADGKIAFYDKDKNYIGEIPIPTLNEGKRVFPTPANAIYIKFYNPSSYSQITISPYYTPEEGGEGYDKYYPYEEPYIVDTGNEVLRQAGSIKDYKEPDGTIHRLVGVVDLGSLTYVRDQSSGVYRFQANVGSLGFKGTTDNNTKGNLSCAKYITKSWNEVTGQANNKTICILFNGSNIAIQDDDYIDVDAFKSAMSGVYIYFELATPTTEQGTPFAENLPINDYGMLYWLDSSNNLVGIPQGAKIFYPVNYKGFVDDLYSKVDGNSDDYALNSELNAKFETYLKSLTGYDGTATQVLKNVEGTLTWVTEGE